MRKVKWGVLGTAYIFERDTAEGMKQAENCELYAIAGRSMEKAGKNTVFRRRMEVMKRFLRMTKSRRFISHCRTQCIMSGH